MAFKIPEGPINISGDNSTKNPPTSPTPDPLTKKVDGVSQQSIKHTDPSKTESLHPLDKSLSSIWSFLKEIINALS